MITTNVPYERFQSIFCCKHTEIKLIIVLALAKIALVLVNFGFYFGQLLALRTGLTKSAAPSPK